RSETSGPDESPLSLLVQRRARVARTNPSARGPMDEFGNHTHRVTPTKRPAPFPMRASSCPVKVYATFVSTVEDSLVWLAKNGSPKLMMQAGPPVSGLAAAIVREPRKYRVPPVRSPPLHSSTICLLSLFDACPESCVAFTTSAVLDGESLN